MVSFFHALCIFLGYHAFVMVHLNARIYCGCVLIGGGKAGRSNLYCNVHYYYWYVVHVGLTGHPPRVIDKMSTFFLSTDAASKPLCRLRRHVDKRNVDSRHVKGVRTSILSGPSINLTPIPNPHPKP